MPYILDTLAGLITTEPNGDTEPVANLDDAIKQIKRFLHTQMKDQIYPVGSVYTSVSVNTNPATVLGFGTWTALGGTTLVGYDGADADFDAVGDGNNTNGETGAKTHTLVEAEVPAHVHTRTYQQQDGSSGNVTSGTNLLMGGVITTLPDQDVDSTSFGGDGAHNNLQPYTVVYRWKRTA